MAVRQDAHRDCNKIEDPLDQAPPQIPIEPYVASRHMFTHDPPDPTENILIVDRAADISCVGQGFTILFHSGESMRMNTALARSPSNTFDIVSAAAVIEDPTSLRGIIIIINQAIHIPDLQKHESPLHTDQAWNHRVYVNDLAKCFHDREGKAGLQNIEVDGCVIPLKHDGRKYFISIREPWKEDWDTCQIVELTSPESWNHINTTERGKHTIAYSDKEIKEWSYRLGRLDDEMTKYTLAAMMQLVNSVEAESRVMLRRHLKCSLPCLRPKRLAEGFSSYTFFPSVRSTRGYTCVQEFVLTQSGYTYGVLPLKHKA